MPRVLYNEGRVVGYSAYEIYVRHALTADPDTEPATESEWLASTLGLGSSMLLKIEPDELPLESEIHCLEFALPGTSRLVGASTIIGSLFIGSGDENTWSQKVTDYGELISNTSTSSPTSSTIPMKTLTDITASMADQIKDYAKVIDAIVVQDGTWTANSDDPPEKTLSPDFTKRARVRLQVKGAITTGFYLLLSGFTDSGVIYGVSDTTGTPTNPYAGDFLGPAAFPWAAKIILTLPTTALLMAGGASYTRSFPNDAESIKVEYAPIIDFDSMDISQYYEVNDDAKVSVDIDVVETARPGIAVLASRAVSGTVNGVTVAIPPDLIGGMTAAAVDECAFGPLASYSPYSVHMFNGDNAFAKALLLETECAGTFGFIRDNRSLVVSEIDKVTDPVNPSSVPVSDNYVTNSNALQFLNSTYMYMYRMSANSGYPDPADLADVHTFATQQQIYGYVSDKFIQEECLTYSDMEGYFGSSGTATFMITLGNLALYNQLKSEGSKYVYFLMSIASNPKVTGATQQVFFVPVEASTGRISVMLPQAQTIYALPASGDTPAQTVTLDLSGTGMLNYLGSWWDGTPDSGDERLADWGPIEDHPMVKIGIPTSDVYYRSKALTPLPPASYGYYYYDWYKTVTMEELVGNAEGAWAATGIHEDFKSMSIMDFLTYSVTHYVGMAIGSTGSEKSSNILSFSRYIYGKSTVKATAEGGATTVDETTVYNVPLKADKKISAFISKDHIFIPAEFNLYQITWDGDDYTISSTPSTSEYVNQLKKQWSAVSVSGLHETKAISLTDDEGSPLTLIGANGAPIENNYIIWQELLEALNSNKKIDILGILKELKAAMGDAGITTGTPYAIQFNSDGTVSLVPINS